MREEMFIPRNSFVNLNKLNRLRSPNLNSCILKSKLKCEKPFERSSRILNEKREIFLAQRL